MKESILCSHLRCAGNPTVTDPNREADNERESERERCKSELKGSVLNSFIDEQGIGGARGCSQESLFICSVEVCLKMALEWRVGEGNNPWLRAKINSCRCGQLIGSSLLHCAKTRVDPVSDV